MSMLLGLRELLGDLDAITPEVEPVPAGLPDEPVVEIEAAPRRPAD